MDEGMWGDTGGFSFSPDVYGFSEPSFDQFDYAKFATQADLAVAGLDDGLQGKDYGIDPATLSSTVSMDGTGLEAFYSPVMDESNYFGGGAKYEGLLSSLLNSKTALGLGTVGLNALGGYLAADVQRKSAGEAASLQRDLLAQRESEFSRELARRQKEIDDQVARAAWAPVQKEHWRPITEGGRQTGLLATAMKGR